MAHYHDLHEDALDANKAGRYADEALLWRRAAAAALEIGDRAGWFKATVEAAAATQLVGDSQTALALLLDARQSEPADAPILNVWAARTLMYGIVRTTRPERGRLDALLEDLCGYAAGRPVPAADLAALEAAFLDTVGDPRSALARCETAWQVHDGAGYSKCWSAAAAARLCVGLDRPAACRDWIEAIGRADNDKFARVAIRQTQRRLDLALAECAPPADLTALLRTLTDRTLTTQAGDLAADLRDYAIRVHLLDPENGDPAHRLHPAWGELRRRLPHRWNVHYRFDARLLFLDYRLACLRHAAGLPAVDDKYHRQPDDLTQARRPVGWVERSETHPARTQADPSPATPDLPIRLHKARAAADWAMVYARKLDGWLQCDWRQLKVAEARARIEAIATALQLGR